MTLVRLSTVLIFAACALCGQDAGRTAHIIRASGEATVTAQPDRAQVTVGVSTQATRADGAAAQNAARTTQVLEALKRALGEKGQVKTIGYSITPDYQYPKDGSSPKITGYTASNTVLVTVDDLALIGRTIDTATQAGANNIAGIAFTLRDDEAVRTQALRAAAAKARASAEAIAEALHVQVIGIMQAESTETPSVRPVFHEMGAAMRLMAAAPTPIEAGTLDIHAGVTVTLEIR